MDKSVIVIDDSDSEHSDGLPHHQPGPSSSIAESSRTASQLSSSLSLFQRKRRRHDSSTHPLARNSGRALPKSSRQRDGDERIPMNKQSHRISKSRASRSSRQTRSRGYTYGLLPKHYKAIQKARAEEAHRQQLGLPKSRLRIPCETDPEEMHREFFVKSTEAKKIEEDIEKGYIVRVEERHAVQLDDLDPELLTGRPLTEREAYWVKKKQARRAGPRSSSWPSTMPTHDQHTEYISFTKKSKNLFDPNALECCECGSKLWGTSIIFPLSRPATSRPAAHIVEEDAPLCVGCSRLFYCVKDRNEKMNMINWIIDRQVPPTSAREPDDQALMALCRRRVAMMRARAHDHYKTLPANFVTPEELYESVKYDNYNCYLIGSPMCLAPGRFNSLSFDHIFPISIAMMKDNCWSIENLQPLSHCMNQVKGNEANKEAKRWLINFKTYYHSREFKP